MYFSIRKNIICKMDNPRLIENSTKNFLFQTLQKCHYNRVILYYYITEEINFTYDYL